MAFVPKITKQDITNDNDKYKYKQIFFCNPQSLKALYYQNIF